MKKIFLIIAVFSSLFISCSKSNGERPIITVDSIYIDGKKEKDIAQTFPENARVEVYATLKAVKGNTLSAFNVKLECGDHCPMVDVEYDKRVGGIIDNPDYKPEYSILFNDGVMKTEVVIKTHLMSNEKGEFKFNLYLNNAGNNEEEATKEELIFNVGEVKE